MYKQLSELIDMAVVCLEKLNLAEGTIKDYRQSAFRPLERRLADQGYVDSELLRSQENFFFQQFEDGTISQHTLNWQIRGIRVLVEILDTGGFTWKVFSKKKVYQSHSVPSLIHLCRLKTVVRSIRTASTLFADVFFYSFLAMGVRMLPVSHPSMSGGLWLKFQNQGQRAWMM